MNDDTLFQSVRLFLGACALLKPGQWVPFKVYSVLEPVLVQLHPLNPYARRMHSDNQRKFQRGMQLSHAARIVLLNAGRFQPVLAPTDLSEIRRCEDFADVEWVARRYLDAVFPAQRLYQGKILKGA